MTDREMEVWEGSYEEDGDVYRLLVTDQALLDSLDEELSVPLIMNYQMSTMEEQAVKELIAAQTGTDAKTLESMSVEDLGQMLGVELKSFEQEKEDDDGNTVDVTCVDIRPVFVQMIQSGMLDKETILSMRDSMQKTIDTMGSSLVKFSGTCI